MSERSSARDAGELTRAMQQGGWLSPDATPTTPPLARPWFIHAVLGAAGWLAGGFVLIFIALLFDVDTPAGFFCVGVVLLGASAASFATRGGAFLHQLAFALMAGGQAGVAIWIADALDSLPGTLFCVALLQVPLIALLRSFAARAFCASLACVAWALSIRLAWWNELDRSTDQSPIDLTSAALAWLLTWPPLGLGVALALAWETIWVARGWHTFVRPALAGILLGMSFGTLTTYPIDGTSSLDRSGLVLWPLLSLASALLSMACAFRLRSRALQGAALAAALLHVYAFYYLLGASLLVKSAILVAIGVLLLGASLALRPARETAG